MDDVGWLILSFCILIPLSLFFGLNTLALRSFSRLKLQDAFRKAEKESLIDEFLSNAELLTIVCGLMRIITNTGIIFLLVFLLRQHHFALTFILAVCIIELFSLVIPHAWAKHTGEEILPAKFVRRLAGVQDADPEQAQDQRQEEILNVVEQGRIEGVVDEEEMEMIENVLELDETAAEEIMTPRTDLIAINIKDDLSVILETIRDKGHSRIPVYEETIDNIIGLVYAKDLLTEIGKDLTAFDLKSK
ncbi:MAG: CBS domain-containing protein, partial [Planctomycetota bacterium]